ncbi:MAG: DNA gyrase C-terminal beta-propeller domain-containing protein [Planctomycetota bacterium]|nr:DNA gyrase C-terminal beta-propeller domain-containing protein [Planctomycetota bacterium]
MKRQPLTTFRKQHRGGKGVIGATTKDGDFVKDLYIASTHDYILLFTTKGKLYWLKVYDIPQMGRASMGRSIANLLELSKGERITSMLPVRDFDERFVFMATRRGIVKKTKLSEFDNPRKVGIRALNLEDGDLLVSVCLTGGDDEIILGTRDGMAIKFHESEVRAMGRTARGNKGIKLRGEDYVVGMVRCETHTQLLTVCENGFGKRTAYDQYRSTHRNGIGVKNISTNERNGKVESVLGVHEDDEILIVTAKGKIIRSTVRDISMYGRGTQGVRVISLGEDDYVANVSRIKATPSNGDESDEEDEIEGEKAE